MWRASFSIGNLHCWSDVSADLALMTSNPSEFRFVEDVAMIEGMLHSLGASEDEIASAIGAISGECG
jgi:hypothetical protein